MVVVDAQADQLSPMAMDDLDDLFDYEVNNEIYRDVDTSMDVPAKRPTNTSRSAENGYQIGGLGIDEEIKVVRKRAPIAKLDESRLLASNGIPKLRRIARTQFKFKGKGHEYSDAARLLNIYQLWLDDLYPRAKFVDGLTMIEKLGHSKRMQTMRKEWMKEGKLHNVCTFELENRLNDQKQAKHTSEEENGSRVSPAQGSQTTSSWHISDDATIYRAHDRPDTTREGLQRRIENAEELFVSDVEEEDDLNALLAEDEARRGSIFVPSKGDGCAPPQVEDDFGDEMDAIDDVGDTSVAMTKVIFTQVNKHEARKARQGDKGR